jgi:predicted RNase H-like HicB family nuclease
MRPGKRQYTFQVVIEKEPEADYFTAYAPSLAGCFRRGRTLVEARESVRSAIRERLESLLATAQPVVQLQKFLRVDELTIEVDE